MTDPARTEYACLDAERRGGEAYIHLAAFLGVGVAEVLELRDAGGLGAAIERRNARHDPVAARRHLERHYIP